MPDNRGEVVLTSKTQSPETIQKVALELGYSDTTVEEISDESPVDIPAEGIPAGEQPIDEEQIPPAEETVAEADEPVIPEVVEAAPPAPAETEQQKLSRRKRAILKRDEQITRLSTENETFKRELQELKAGLTKPAADTSPVITTKPPVETAEPEPTLDDVDENGNLRYPDYTAHTKALARWTLRDDRRIEREQAAQATAREESDKQKKQAEDQRVSAEFNKQSFDERWTSSSTAGKAMFADFDTVMNTPRPGFAPPKLLGTAVTDREKAAILGYWLMSHPDDEKRCCELATLPAKFTDAQERRAYAQLGKELDRIEALLPTVAAADDYVEDPDMLEEIDSQAAEETPAPAPKRVAAPPPVAIPAPKSPAKKATPPPSVGTGRNLPPRSLNTLSQDTEVNRTTLKHMDPDEYRRMREGAAPRRS